MEPDWDQLRSATPGTQRVVHLNNAGISRAWIFKGIGGITGASLQSQEVLATAQRWLEDEQHFGGYELVEREAAALELPYTALAALLGCDPEEIAIVQSATVAWQQVFFGLKLAAGDRILTSISEYGSNYIGFLQVAKRTGAVVEVVPETVEGDIDLDALEHLILSGRKPSVIAITHVPTSSGRVYDAAAVGKLARLHGVPYLLDACQSVGQMPLDVHSLQCDWLTGTSRKFLRGPRGIGFLYASRGIMARTEPATLDSHGAAWTSAGEFDMVPTALRYEQYEINFAAKAGFGLAVQQAVDVGMGHIWQRLQGLAALLRVGLEQIPGVTVQDHGRCLCAIVSFTKENIRADQMCQTLRAAGINVSVSGAPSTRLDFDKRGLTDVVRASIHYFNNEKDIESLLNAVAGAYLVP